MKGNHPHAAKELSNAEEDLLFCTGEFGAENPEALQCTVWWLLALHFGFHAQDESKKLKWATLFFKNRHRNGKGPRAQFFSILTSRLVNNIYNCIKYFTYSTYAFHFYHTKCCFFSFQSLMHQMSNHHIVPSILWNLLFMV